VPKIVDPHERRQAVVDAVFRVVQREGFEQASLRNVATEAGLAIGSVRHYFENHADLVAFAMQAMGERLRARLTAHLERLQIATPQERHQVVIDMLAEVLPLDEKRHQEAVVWLEFTTAARTRPELRPHANDIYTGLLALTTRILTRASETANLNLDVPLEARRLCALLDGLTMQAVLHPTQLSPAAILSTLQHHLESLWRVRTP
jgi:DNA-binding transcriptional regulator YbjK